VRAARFHGSLSVAQKRAVLHDFLAEGLSVVVATVAFGLGVDKSDVRAVRIEPTMAASCAC
jgi:ATP-dependent DNA helicase RecQ